MKAFISYGHQDRPLAGAAKAMLEQVGIQAFLAHEDIEVSEEWRDRILEELRTCDVFVALLSQTFTASAWCPQELGFIVSRPQVRIVPLSLDGTRSSGFISHLQSPRIPAGGAIPLELLVVPLARRFPRVVLPELIKVAGAAGDFRSAEARVRPLLEFFSEFTADEAQTFAELCIGNAQIWAANLCRSEYLPRFLEVKGDELNALTREALQYQIEHQEWYRAGKSDAST